MERDVLFTALNEVAVQLEKEGVESEIINLGRRSGKGLYRLQKVL